MTAEHDRRETLAGAHGPRMGVRQRRKARRKGIALPWYGPETDDKRTQPKIELCQSL